MSRGIRPGTHTPRGQAASPCASIACSPAKILMLANLSITVILFFQFSAKNKRGARNHRAPLLWNPPSRTGYD